MFMKNFPINANYLHSNTNDISLITSKKNNRSIIQDFSNLINQAITKVNNIQNEANQSTEIFEINPSKISLNEVMINLEKSTIGIQMAVQIKNKILSAYRDIMNIQL